MRVRTAEVVAVLSLATDLATRAAFEHGLRSTVYALRLATAVGADADACRQAYYLTALAGAGDAGADLALLMDLPARLRRPTLPGAIAATARRLDRLRTQVPGPAAAAVLRSDARRGLERRLATVAAGLAPLTDDSAWDAMLAAEPLPHRTLTAADLDTALAALGVFGALVSPYFRGHSAAVSALAALVARQRGLDEEQVTLVRRAGLVHDLGRAGVPREVWERSGQLAPDEVRDVRAAARGPQRLLARVPALAEIGAVTTPSGHREPARILAAAAAYCALVAERPQRPALAPGAAATALRADAAAGRFDADVVESVLAAVASTQPQRS